MAGVAERLIWKNNKLQILYKKLENAEEQMFFASTLGSHSPWALGLSSGDPPGLCKDFPDGKTWQIQVAADIGQQIRKDGKPPSEAQR